MTFPEVIQAIIDGKTVTKLEWNDDATRGRLRDGCLMLYRNSAWHQWIISDGDLLGEDWVILR